MIFGRDLFGVTLNHQTKTTMKTFTNIASPFILMLVPVFLIIGLLMLNRDTEIPAEKFKASTSFQIPAFRMTVQSIF